MAPNELPDDFKEFLKLLDTAQIEYLVIGGYAVAYHGYPRPTGDLDIWIATHPENAVRVAKLLQEFGFPVAFPVDTFTRPQQMIRMGYPPVRIELFTTIPGLDFSTAYLRRIEATIDGVPVKFVNREDLKTSKIASGRKKDLADLENLP